MAPAMPRKRMDKQHPSIVKANAEPQSSNEKEFKTKCLLVWWNLVSPRGSEQNLCDPKHMKIALHVNHLLP